MIEIPVNREDALDIVWGIIADYNARWDAILGDQSGITRRDIERVTGWSYSTVHRLVKELERRKQVAAKWTHQHQSYWEGHYRNV